jgi:polyisoprenoid-binding protein YceI
MALQHPTLALAALLLLFLATSAGGAPLAWGANGEVRYLARDQAASWEGVAPVASLSAWFDPNDSSSLTLSASVDPAEFRSGNGLRDAQARRSVFNVGTFPTIELRASSDPTLAPRAFELDTPTTLRLEAELDLHGVTQSLPIDATLTLREDGDGRRWIEASARFEISLEAHGMQRPRLLSLVTEDRVEVRVELRAEPN